MVKFVHSSTKGIVIDELNFVNPNINSGHTKHGLNPPIGTFFLSMSYDDGSSDWLKKNSESEWNKGKLSYYDVDFYKMKILVINDDVDIMNMFHKYGIKRYDSPSDNNYYRCIEMEIKSIMENIHILENFIDTLENSKPKFKELCTEENLLNHKVRNYQVFKNEKISVPRKGINPEFVLDIYNILRQHYIKLYDTTADLRSKYNDMEIYKKIDYAKMSEEYNGIYFSRNLFKRTKMITGWGREEYKRYIEWLKSDTLAIWNWCF